MIERYARAEMSAIFTDQARMDGWLRVEQATLDALVATGVAPASAAEALHRATSVDVDRVTAREAEIHHDLAAFVDVVAADAPEAAGWVHYGLTSSDVIDTALALQLGRAGSLVLLGLEQLQAAVLRRAREHRDSVMLGRTHGMPAETITFGAKVAGWWHQLDRDARRVTEALADISVGKLSGAVGMYSGVGPDVERHVLEALGIERDPSATQIVQRDRLAALLGAFAVLAGTMERIALEVRHLQRADVAEAAEPFGRSQKGSSAMPHKRNPIVAEQVCGLARIVRANAGVAFENIALWHERDISHSSTERIIVPDTFILVDYLLAKVTWLVDGLDVYADRMRANLAAQRGMVASQRILLALVEAGMVRDEAYRVVQEASARVREHASLELADAVVAVTSEAGASEPHASEPLSLEELRILTDPAFVPPGVEAIFEELDAAVAAAQAGPVPA